ncbi:MAG: 4-hydroxy-tetrahydrodipicolinate synthase [Armatimonadia bacterium]|nr:4-hydroxy-tetrahydrodipicolinate synthase [Armatimonadia bacterium]
MPDLPRVLTAMVTPFDDALQVDLGRAKELAARLVEETSGGGVLVAGTTGETPTLTGREKLDLFGAVVSAVGDRAFVLAGTGNYNTAESVELSKAAQDAGVHGVMLTTPYYNKPPQDCLIRHFTECAAAVDLPIVLYQVPSRTATRLEPQTTVRLAREVDNIVALKDAGANINETSSVRLGAPDGFLIYSGNDGETLPILAVGGYGVISVASHVAGPAIARMIDAFVAGDNAAALKEHLGLLPIIDVLFTVTNPIPVKAALGLRGMDVGGLRPPLYAADPALKGRIESVLRESGVL